MCKNTSSITSINVWASSPWRPPTTSSSFLLEKIASIRKGSSYMANARSIKRLQAEVLKLRKKDESRSNQCSLQDRWRWAIDVPPSNPGIVAVP